VLTDGLRLRAADEGKREEALKRLQIIDSGSEVTFNNLVKLATELINVPIALVTFIEKERLWCKAKVGLDLVDCVRAMCCVLRSS
jgi:hypothetical protein